MPASQRNKKRAPAPTPEPLRWKRQMEHDRLVLSTAVSAATAEPQVEEEYRPPEAPGYFAPADEAGQGSPEVWKRQLEYGRLSAMAIEPSLLFPGPGAAGGDVQDEEQQALQVMMMAQAAAAQEAQKKKKTPPGDIIKKLTKARLIKEMKKSFLQLTHNWIACWIFIPATFFLFIHYNGELKKTADWYKEESKKSPGPLPGEDQKLKTYLRNLVIYKAVEWMHWATFMAFWYGLLMLVVILIYGIVVILKCIVTVGISC